MRPRHRAWTSKARAAANVQLPDVLEELVLANITTGAECLEHLQEARVQLLDILKEVDVAIAVETRAKETVSC